MEGWRRSAQAILLAGLMASLVTSCASHHMETDYAVEHDFPAHARFRFETTDLLALDTQRIQEGVRQALEARGWTLAELEKGVIRPAPAIGGHALEQTGADPAQTMIVRIQLREQQRNEIRQWPSAAPGRTEPDLYVHSYQRSTILLSLLEPARGREVWRGVLSFRTSALPQEPAVRQHWIRDRIAELFADFPPGHSASTPESL